MCMHIKNEKSMFYHNISQDPVLGPFLATRRPGDRFIEFLIQFCTFPGKFCQGSALHRISGSMKNREIICYSYDLSVIKYNIRTMKLKIFKIEIKNIKIRIIKIEIKKIKVENFLR